MEAVQRTLLQHFSEVFDVELEPEMQSELEPELAPEIVSPGSPAKALLPLTPADATVLMTGGGPTPTPRIRPTELAEAMPPAGFAWGGTT